jgi:hypothetical protein
MDTQQYQPEGIPMKTITFDGHMHVPQRQVTLTQDQLHSVFEAMKYELRSHIEYGRINPTDSLFPADKIVCNVCKAHDVDPYYKKDRVAFFNAVIDAMENPYA